MPELYDHETVVSLIRGHMKSYFDMAPKRYVHERAVTITRNEGSFLERFYIQAKASIPKELFEKIREDAR